MELGAVDARGRAYDAAFATLKRRILDADGERLLAEGETETATATVEASLFLRVAGKEQPVLLPTWGELTATSERLFFLAGEVDRDDRVTTLNVEAAVPPTAVDHFFRQGGGREFLEVPLKEVRGVERRREGVAVTLRAPWPGPGESELELRLAPASAAVVVADLLG